jgi:hypothetical protein
MFINSEIMKRKRNKNIKDRLVWAKSPTNGKWYPAYIVDKLWVEEYSTGDIWEAEEVSPIHKCPIPRRKYCRDNNASTEVPFEKEEMEMLYRIAEQFNIVFPMKLLKNCKRATRNTAAAKHVFRYYLYTRRKYTLRTIAMKTGTRVHGTVYSSINNTRNWYETDKEFKKKVDACGIIVK